MPFASLTRYACHHDTGLLTYAKQNDIAVFLGSALMLQQANFVLRSNRFIADGREYPFDRPGLEIWPTVDVAFADEPQTLQYSVG